MESWILIVLVTGNWLAYPFVLDSKESCEKDYVSISEVFKEKGDELPEHICAQVVGGKSP